MHLAEIFARNVNERRKILEISKKELAEIAGVSRNTINLLTSGKARMIQFVSAEKVAVALRCNPWQLFDEDMNWTAYKWANTYQGVNKNE